MEYQPDAIYWCRVKANKGHFLPHSGFWVLCSFENVGKWVGKEELWVWKRFQNKDWFNQEQIEYVHPDPVQTPNYNPINDNQP